MWPLGIPAFVFIILWRRRHTLNNKHTKLALGALYSEYEYIGSDENDENEANEVEHKITIIQNAAGQTMPEPPPPKYTVINEDVR